MNPWIVRNITSALWEKKNGLEVKKCFCELDRTQWYSPEQIKELQWIKLQNLLRHCYENVPYYRNLFNKLKLKPNDFKSIEDLRKIFLLEKSILQNHFDDLIARDEPRPFIIRKTSGSTATPLITHVDKRTFSYQIAAKYRGRSWWDWTKSDRYVTLRGRYVQRPNPLTIIRDYAVDNKILLSAFDLSNKSTMKYLGIMRWYKPKFMYGWLSGIYAFAQILEKNQLNPSHLNLSGICTTAEILYDYQRNYIESIFQCPVINEYGCAEVGIIAFQCPRGKMHLTSENLLIEFLKAENYERQDTSGNIIITDLNNYIMPLLRYKIGDIGKLETGLCSCGRGLPLINIEIGRKNDMVILKDGKRVYPAIFAFMVGRAITQYGNKINKFQVVQRTVNDFLIKMVVESGFESKARQFFQNAFRTQLGNDITVDFKFFHSLPKEKSGKFREFISEIPGA